MNQFFRVGVHPSLGRLRRSDLVTQPVVYDAMPSYADHASSRATSPDDRDEVLRGIADFEGGIRATLMHRILRVVGPTRAFATVYRHLGPPLDRVLLRVSRGRAATRMYGFPALLLRTTGAKTGRLRSSPLLYVREGSDFFVVGTNFGTAHHPAWTWNLLKEPRASIVIGAQHLQVRAGLVEGADYERIFAQFEAIFPGYQSYRQRLTQRTPRMFRLSLVFAPEPGV